MHTKLLLFILISAFYTAEVFGQHKNAVLDSLNRQYIKEADLKQKSRTAGRLSLFYLSVDPAKADSFGKLAIQHAEISRDRPTMVRAYSNNADRYVNMAGIKENIPKAIDYYNKAYNLARANRMEKEMVAILLGMATVQRLIPDADKAMNYTAQAFALISDRSLDSLEARCYISFGNNYLLKKEKLLALKNYFNALKIAEVKKDPQLLRDSYMMLGQFYTTVENYDKAIDYVVKASDEIDEIKDNNAKYLKVNDLIYIGALFVQKKQYDLARSSYDDAIALADKLQYDPLKLTCYLNIFNMYLIANQPHDALNYFNSKPELKDYLVRTGYSPVIDHAYAYIYADMNRFDSAAYYYKKALPFFSSQMGNLNKVNFFTHYAKFQVKAQDYHAAINLLDEAALTAKQMNDMEWEVKIYKQLDSAYQLKGDYKTALFYSNNAQLLKDSLDLLGKEEDILQLQLADEDERHARVLLAAEEKKKQRHQFQYLAITIGIAVLFVLLVMLGTFKVSAGTIRIVGFFTFLMFFEFIFLISKKSVYTITHGEPWMDLAFMIALAALLLPLHHWVEHKVIHYLTSKHMIKIDKSKYFLTRIFKKDKAEKVDEVLQ